MKARRHQKNQSGALRTRGFEACPKSALWFHIILNINQRQLTEWNWWVWDILIRSLFLWFRFAIQFSTIVKLASKVAGMPPAPERHEQVLQVWAESPTFEQEVTPPASRNARGRRQGRQPLNKQSNNYVQYRYYTLCITYYEYIYISQIQNYNDYVYHRVYIICIHWVTVDISLSLDIYTYIHLYIWILYIYVDIRLYYQISICLFYIH